MAAFPPTPQTPYAPKVGSVVNISRVPLPSQEQATLSVAVRDYLDQVQNRTKERRYTFDVAYGPAATNADVYNGAIRELAGGVTKGLNGTVFAYGATGSGKTFTMVGTPGDPGLMVRSLSDVFAARAALGPDGGGEDFGVTCSYLEVIYDLLVKASGPLELREDPDAGPCVAGLRRIEVSSAAEIMAALEEGNRRRKTDSTEANAASSRSHAILEIAVTRTPRGVYRGATLSGKLRLVDLAGSLLALANCINALGKGGRTGTAYVPYRNSKLTRLLKDALSGNSRTAMVATVASGADNYHNTVNTLKYADRAKEIKTHVVQNVGSVEAHVADYQRIIDGLQSEVQALRSRVASAPPRTAPGAAALAAAAAAAPEFGPQAATAGAAAAAAAAGAGSEGGGGGEAEALALIDALAGDINDNALFELEDVNVMHAYELQNIDAMLEAGTATPEERREALERRAALREAAAANAAEAGELREDIAQNEAARREIERRIDAAIEGNSSVNFLSILSTFRIQAVRLQELKFQVAVRDQVIREQRDVIANVWRILTASGLTREAVLDIAHAEGILGALQLPEEGAGPPTVGASRLPPALGASGASGAAAAAAAAAARGGGQASLTGGGARYRYKFWAQYSDADGGGAGAFGPPSPGLPTSPDLRRLPPAGPGPSAIGGAARDPQQAQQRRESPSRIPHAPGAAAAAAGAVEASAGPRAPQAAAPAPQPGLGGSYAAVQRQRRDSKVHAAAAAAPPPPPKQQQQQQPRQCAGPGAAAAAAAAAPERAPRRQGSKQQRDGGDAGATAAAAAAGGAGRVALGAGAIGSARAAGAAAGGAPRSSRAQQQLPPAAAPPQPPPRPPAANAAAAAADRGAALAAAYAAPAAVSDKVAKLLRLKRGGSVGALPAAGGAGPAAAAPPPPLPLPPPPQPPRQPAAAPQAGGVPLPGIAAGAPALARLRRQQLQHLLAATAAAPPAPAPAAAATAQASRAHAAAAAQGAQAGPPPRPGGRAPAAVRNPTGGAPIPPQNST
ncbi:kinesin [Raphidocelis subcapitata]|uniref:Kinesin n=1 Tax=Raphidocelis subcapitata TaxID=307507 RepID=A0A2V0P1M0_9CHLO|nr:kinesin [Raphidocelis subcapitata]|eukprot:GBF91733.1 kinesin [Raphidocelis subcapitata]